MRRAGRGPDFETVRQEATALLRALEQGEPAPFYVFCGADDFQREACLRNALNRLVPAEHRETCLRVLDGGTTPAERVAAELESTTFRFGDEPRRVVLVREAPWFAAGGSEAAARLIARLEAGLMDDVVLVCDVHGGVDRRQKLTKLALERGVLIEFPELAGDSDTAAFCRLRLRRLGKQISPAAAAELAERCGVDSQILANELDKLAAYVGERETITPDDVREMVAPTVELTLFELVDAVAEHDTPRALAQLDALLAQRAEPFLIFGMLMRQFRLLLQARYLLDAELVTDRLLRLRPFDFHQAVTDGREGTSQLDRWRAATAEVLPNDGRQGLLNQHYFPLWKTLGQARKVTTPELVAAMERLLQADLGLKTSHLEPGAELELLVAELCSRPGVGATIPWDALLEP